jgi:glycerol-3-phosphate acyltransferase PlsX
MIIGLDVMGGDYAPAEAISGVQQYLAGAPHPDVRVMLIGQRAACEPYMASLQSFGERVIFTEAPEVVGMHEHPTKALKEKPHSSISIGFGYLKAGRIDAFIGAGNTGAMMVGAMFTVKTVEGVQRPTIATPVPTEHGAFNLLLDVGANADCKPEHLVQFGQLGSLYVEHVMKRPSPRVALLNLGEEEGKGNILAQATYPLLRDDTTINFVGNVEGRDVFEDKADVIVCDGFTGNVILKLAESVYTILSGRHGVRDPFLDNFNYERFGGTPILGINAPVIIGHGISSGAAFNEMIGVAERIVSSKLVDVFKQHFAAAPAPEV